MRNKSFSQKLAAGTPPEELKRYYCLTDREYVKIVECLQEIRKMED